MHALTYRLNAYFAVLIITVFGAGATMIILHVARAQNLSSYVQGSEAPMYSALHLGAHR